MSSDTLKRIGLFFAFVAVQVLVLGHVHLFHVATPLFYVYFVLLMPRNLPKWASLLWSFAMGLVLDIFSNTFGVAAASMTLIGAIQPYYFELFLPRDSADNIVPKLSTIGLLKYTYYAVPLVLFYCLVFYTLEMFSFYNALQWVLCVVGSTAVTLLLVYTFEIATFKK